MRTGVSVGSRRAFHQFRTLKPFESVYEPASGFVTVTSRAPVAALPDSEMTSVSFVALLYVTELTVIPRPKW